jgi:hypothetical protein
MESFWKRLQKSSYPDSRAFGLISPVEKIKIFLSAVANGRNLQRKKS